MQSHQKHNIFFKEPSFKATVITNYPEFRRLCFRLSIFVHGGERVVRWCWVNVQSRGVLLIWILVAQGPTALAAGAGGGSFDIFLSSIISFFSLPLSGRRPDID